MKIKVFFILWLDNFITLITPQCNDCFVVSQINISLMQIPFLWHINAAITHWGRVTHICVDNLTIIGSDNGLSPCRRQAIIWTNARILLIGPLGRNFSEILNKIHTFSFKEMHLKMSSRKWQLFCLGLNVINTRYNMWPNCLQHTDIFVTTLCVILLNISHIISMGWCKKYITPLLTHWSYAFLSLTHRYYYLYCIQ